MIKRKVEKDEDKETGKRRRGEKGRSILVVSRKKFERFFAR